MSSVPITYPQAIEALAPTAVYSMTDAFDYSTLQWYSPEVPQPTQEQCDAEIVALTADQPLQACKTQASNLLFATDWTTIPDVSNPATSTPYLMNPNDFVIYRSQVRQLAVYPVANPSFPPVPTAQWSS